MSRLLAFTLTSDPEHPGCRRLVKSAKYWGWDLKVRHWVDDWERTTFAAEQRGTNQMIIENEPDFILYLDAWDTVFVGPPQEIYPSLQPGKVMLSGDMVGADAWQHVPQHIDIPTKAFPKVGEHEFRYANIGVLWGDAKIVHELNRDYLENYYPNKIVDQDYYNMTYLYERTMRRDRLHIDHKAQWALNCMGIMGRHLQVGYSGRFIYTPCDTRPVILHRPGHAGSEKLMVPMPGQLDKFYGFGEESIDTSRAY